MTKCFVIEANGSSRIEEIDGYIGFRKIVGGYLEVIQLPVAQLCAFIDEEGKIHGKQFNPVASIMASACGFPFNSSDTGIVGTMIVVGRPDENGEETSIPDPMLEKLTFIAQKIRTELKKALKKAFNS